MSPSEKELGNCASGRWLVSAIVSRLGIKLSARRCPSATCSRVIFLLSNSRPSSAVLTPCAAARLHHLYASTKLVGTPLPKQNKTPRLPWAVAFPLHSLQRQIAYTNSRLIGSRPFHRTNVRAPFGHHRKRLVQRIFSPVVELLLDFSLRRDIIIAFHRGPALGVLSPCIAALRNHSTAEGQSLAAQFSAPIQFCAHASPFSAAASVCAGSDLFLGTSVTIISM